MRAPNPPRSRGGVGGVGGVVAGGRELPVVDEAALVVIVRSYLLTADHMLVLMTANSCLHAFKVDKSREPSRRVLLWKFLHSIHPTPLGKVVFDLVLTHVVWEVTHPQVLTGALP